MDSRSGLFLHEEVLLLVLRDREGTVEFGANYSHAMGGAILAELLLRERIGVEEDGKRKLATVLSDEPVGDAVIDECLDLVGKAKKPKTLQDWVAKFAYLKDLRHRVAHGLCTLGILRADQDKVLLLFTRKIYPEVDPVPEQEIIERLREAIFTDTEDLEARTVILLSLAKGAGLLGFTFDKKELKARKERIEQVVNGEVFGAATSAAIEALQAAVFVAVIVPSITTAAIH